MRMFARKHIAAAVAVRISGSIYISCAYKQEICPGLQWHWDEHALTNRGFYFYLYVESLIMVSDFGADQRGDPVENISQSASHGG